MARLQVIAALILFTQLVRADDATLHAPPRPLAKDAVTQDWPGFLGPTHNLVSAETKLLKQFPKDGPRLVWEISRGSGYSAPAIVGDQLVMFHRVGEEEVVECLHRETGKRFWRVAYPSNYTDRYGYNDGPRAAAVISDGLAYTLGAAGRLHCIEMSSGKVRWHRDINREYKLSQNFFGCGATPLVEDGKLMMQVGKAGGPTVIALDAKTGTTFWETGKDWGQSYAAPLPATIHGKHRVLVFAGGESNPPTGGLLCINPDDGKIDFTVPWRGLRRESVNGSAPLIFKNDHILLSEAYGTGGTVLEIAPDLSSAKSLWQSESFGTHFMVAMYRDGYLYGVDGHGPADAFLVCVNAETGKEIWRTQPEWKETIPSPNGDRELTLGTYRAWLMPTADGPQVLMLGEYGHLLWADLSPNGFKALDRTRLFLAAETWTPPVLSHGLLYICQNSEDRISAKGPRLLCYDLRGE